MVTYLNTVTKESNTVRPWINKDKDRDISTDKDRSTEINQEQTGTTASTSASTKYLSDKVINKFKDAGVPVKGLIGLSKKGEIWKEIQDKVEGYNYDDYLISNLGRVFNINRCKIMKASLDSNNRLKVGLTLRSNDTGKAKSKKVKTKRVHMLVANSFLPNPNKYKHVKLLDRNAENCSADNLEWCAFRETRINQVVRRGPNREYTLIAPWGEKVVFKSIKEFSKKNRTNRHCISHLINRRINTHKGWTLPD